MKKKLVAIVLCVLSFILNGQNIYTIAGSGLSGYGGEGGLAINCAMNMPYGVALDAAGSIYFSDSNNSCIMKVDGSGILSHIAGTAGFGGYTGDGGLATAAQFNSPLGIAIDASGNIYVADAGNHVIRKINTSGIITTFAGNGTFGYSGDGGPATSAQLFAPNCIAIDVSGNIYCSTASVVRKINTSGIITTFAGNGTAGHSGDGGLATTAQMYSPDGIAFDATGNLYIVDGNKYCIRKVNTSGIINTIAGIPGSGGYSGDGGPATSAQLVGPTGIAVDNSNNIYISDWRVLRKINPSGIISTIAGIINVGGFYGNGVPASTALVNYPEYMSVDALGNLYFCDRDNNRVRMICYSSCLAGVNEIEIKNGFSVFPNPVSNNLNVSSNLNEFENSEIEITNPLGQTVLKQPYSNAIDVSKLPTGYYNVRISKSNKQTYHAKFIKD